MIKGKKNRKAFVEEISGLQNIVANFSSSDQHYTNAMNRLLDYAQSVSYTHLTLPTIYSV